MNRNPFSTGPSDLFTGWFGSSSQSYGYGTDIAAAAAVFGAGLVVGAGFALLVAPKSGRELREDVVRTANRLGTNVRERLPGTSYEEREPHTMSELGEA